MELQTFSNNLFGLTVKTENGEALFDVETVARRIQFESGRGLKLEE